jgi:hypothetical protein
MPIQLKPHQQNVAHALLKMKSLYAVFGTGAGKTLAVLNAIRALEAEHRCSDFYIVGKQASLVNFANDLSRFGVKFRSAPRLMSHQAFLELVSSENRGLAIKRRFSNAALFVDEAHCLNAPLRFGAPEASSIFKSRQVVSALFAAAKYCKYVLLLSATPVLNKPEDFLLAYCILRRQALAGEKKTLASLFFKVDVLQALKREMLEAPQVASHMLWYTPDAASTEGFPRVFRYNLRVPLPDPREAPGHWTTTYYAVDRQYAEGQIQDFYANLKIEASLYKAFWVTLAILQEMLLGRRCVIFSSYVTEGVHYMSLLLHRFLKELRARLHLAAILDAALADDPVLVAQAGEVSASVDRYNQLFTLAPGRGCCLFLSPAAKEGVDLKGTDVLVIHDVMWNAALQQQVIGRGARTGSHLGLTNPAIRIYQAILTFPDSYKQLLHREDGTVRGPPGRKMGPGGTMQVGMSSDAQKRPTGDKRQMYKATFYGFTTTIDEGMLAHVRKKQEIIDGFLRSLQQEPAKISKPPAQKPTQEPAPAASVSAFGKLYPSTARKRKGPAWEDFLEDFEDGSGEETPKTKTKTAKTKEPQELELAPDQVVYHQGQIRLVCFEDSPPAEDSWQDSELLIDVMDEKEFCSRFGRKSLQKTASGPTSAPKPSKQAEPKGDQMDIVWSRDDDL